MNTCPVSVSEFLEGRRRILASAFELSSVLGHGLGHGRDGLGHGRDGIGHGRDGIGHGRDGLMPMLVFVLVSRATTYRSVRRSVICAFSLVRSLVSTVVSILTRLRICPLSIDANLLCARLDKEWSAKSNDVGR